MPSTKAGALYGLRDIATQASPDLNAIVAALFAVGQNYGFKRIETSLVEESKTYSDYYKDRPYEMEKVIVAPLGNKSVSLRTNILPSVFRYYTQNNIAETQPVSKWFYFGNVLSQDARFAAHSSYQYGFEVLGNFNHLAEAQTICAVWDLLQMLGFTDVQMEINMLGDISAQQSYQSILKDYFKQRQFELCESCTVLSGTKPLGILRCDNLDCKLVSAEAPAVVDYLDNAARKHFTDLLEALDELGLPYQLNPQYAGPDGSVKTTVSFRVQVGEESLLVGEGSYHDVLLKPIAGKPTSAFGFHGDLSLLQKALELSGRPLPPQSPHEVYLVPLGELASKKSLRLFRDLIASGVTVYDYFGSAGVKNQLKQAEEAKAPMALIMGQKEAMDEMVILRDVKSGMQEIFSYDKIIEEVKKRLGR